MQWTTKREILQNTTHYLPIISHAVLTLMPGFWNIG